MISLQTVNRVVFEHIEPENLIPGGIDTCIHGLVKYGGESFGVVGITSKRADILGVWTEIEFGGRRILFMPVACFDRTASFVSAIRIPHSARLAMGILRYHRRIPKVIWQSHRIETGFLLSLLNPRRLIQFVHNDSTGLTGANSDSSWKGIAPLYRILERRVLKRADGVVVFNRTDGVRLQGIRPDTVIAQTWFDPDLFPEIGSRAEVRDGSALRVCWVGRLEAQKDPLLAIAVFAEILKSVPNARLFVVGDGSLKRDMFDRSVDLGIEESVTFLGSLDRADVARIMANSDCMLMTSHYEGSPRVLAEASASGLPVAATSGSDPDRAIENGLNGFRVPGRAVRELAAAVLKAQECTSEACRDSASHRAAGPSVARLLSVGQ